MGSDYNLFSKKARQMIYIYTISSQNNGIGDGANGGKITGFIIISFLKAFRHIFNVE